MDLVRFLRVRRKERPLVGLDPAGALLLDQRILPTSWYPLEQLHALLDYTYRHVLGRRESAAIEMGATGGAQVWQGTHRALLRRGDPTRDLSIMVPAWGQYFDFGSLRLDVQDASTLRFTVLDYPDAPACHGTTIAGWHLAAARLSGWPDARVEILERPWQGAAQLSYLVRQR